LSVVLLATYVATTLILRRQAVAHSVPAADVNAAFTTLGFDDLTSQPMRLAQALLPLLPGVVSVLV
jgi:hypothetical protein